MSASIWIFAVYPAIATFITFHPEVKPHILYPLSKVIIFFISFLLWLKQFEDIMSIAGKAGLKKTGVIAGQPPIKLMSLDILV